MLHDSFNFSRPLIMKGLEARPVNLFCTRNWGIISCHYSYEKTYHLQCWSAPLQVSNFLVWLSSGIEVKRHIRCFRAPCTLYCCWPMTERIRRDRLACRPNSYMLQNAFTCSSCRLVLGMSNSVRYVWKMTINGRLSLDLVEARRDHSCHLLGTYYMI